MLYISHRGNILGKNELLENTIPYIDNALKENYDCEIDLWYKDDNLFLGHNNPENKINIEWLYERKDKLWLHCKDVSSILYFTELNHGFNFFYHENDTLTLTSKGFLWVFPGKQPIKNSIGVLPELFNDNINFCYGICSDYIEKYKINYENR